jgi:uncharacterized protein (DUF433 family)
MPVPQPLVTRSEKVMSGAVVFSGTRVPVQTLIDYFEEGDRLDDFLADFPTVSREHAVAVLKLMKDWSNSPNRLPTQQLGFLPGQ